VEHQPVKIGEVERDPPPLPQQKERRGTPVRVHYAFEEVPLNGAARFARAANTVKNALGKFRKTPEGQGKKFLVRAIGPASCRVWRVK
jgi:hypothetical protein